MLKTAIRDDDPVLFVENLVLYNVDGHDPGRPTNPCRSGWRQVPREGTDLTIVAHSYTVQPRAGVADRLAQDGISVEVVDLRSLRPLDMETVARSVRKTSRALIAEEGWSTYGVGAELAARISRVCFDDLDAPVERVGGGRGANALCQAAGARRTAARGQDRSRCPQPVARVRDHWRRTDG